MGGCCSATIVCKSVFWLCNTHTHIDIHTTQNHPSMINSCHLPLSSIDLAKRGLHWLRSPADYNQKDAQFEVFFKPEDTKDRYWVVKFLPLNLSRCHTAMLVLHSTSSSNTSFIVSFERWGRDCNYYSYLILHKSLYLMMNDSEWRLHSAL